MLTALYQWLLYFASFVPLYIIFIISVLSEDIYSNESKIGLTKKILFALRNKSIILLFLLSLIIISMIIAWSIKKWRNNTRIHKRVKRDKTTDELLIPVSCIIPIGLCIFNVYYGIIALFVFLLVGIVVIRSGKVDTCFIFVIMGYRIYENDEITVFSKYDMETLNLLISENINGIEARQISKNVYITM